MRDPPKKLPRPEPESALRERLIATTHHLATIKATLPQEKERSGSGRAPAVKKTSAQHVTVQQLAGVLAGAAIAHALAMDKIAKGYASKSADDHLSLYANALDDLAQLTDEPVIRDVLFSLSRMLIATEFDP